MFGKFSIIFLAWQDSSKPCTCLL